MRPSICRVKPHKLAGAERHLSSILQSAQNDSEFIEYCKLALHGMNTKNIIEGTLQHYGVKTQFIDFVDNHWIALWFGLYTASLYRNGIIYEKYERRNIDMFKFIQSPNPNEYEDAFQYMILVAINTGSSTSQRGVYFGDETIAIDLRSAIPSTFIRPHSQHGWVVRKKLCTWTSGIDDMSSIVVCILRMRIDHVSDWLGNGGLTNPGNLFPDPKQDYGYRKLLKRTDLFGHDIHFVV